MTFARPIASDLTETALRAGVLVLPEGSDDRTLALTPPAVITDQQLAVALDVLEAGIRSAL